MNKKTKLKIESAFLVVLCLLLGVFKGRANQKADDVKTFAIANFTTNIGDMIMTTPLIHAVKARYPNCRVAVIGGNKNSEVLAGNPDIDVYIPCTNFWTALFRLAEFKPDLGIAVNPSPHELALLYLSGARGISVFSHPALRSASFSALAPLALSVPYQEGKYVPGEYLKLLEPFGITASDTKKHLRVTIEAVDRVKKDLYAAGISEDALVVFAPGAGQVFREWAPERFADVAKYAKEKYNAGIAIAGGPGDKALVRKMTDALPGVPVFDGTSQTIEELKALVSIAKAVASNDSGIAYIAEAFDVPAVIIVGVSDANEHPNGSPDAHVVVPDSQKYIIHSLVSNLDTVDTATARAQLDSISSERVIQEFGKLWESLRS